jgi:hypothetical protein
MLQRGIFRLASSSSDALIELFDQNSLIATELELSARRAGG